MKTIKLILTTLFIFFSSTQAKRVNRNQNMIQTSSKKTNCRKGLKCNCEN